MNRKKKIRRVFFLAASIYIVLNIFIFGLMTAYVNSNNIASPDRIAMAEVNSTADQTKFKVLGKTFTMEKDKAVQNSVLAAVYLIMPHKMRACTEIVLKLAELCDL